MQSGSGPKAASWRGNSWNLSENQGAVDVVVSSQLTSYETGCRKMLARRREVFDRTGTAVTEVHPDVITYMTKPKERHSQPRDDKDLNRRAIFIPPSLTIWHLLNW